VRLAYPAYLAATEPLSVLVFGQLSLALFVIIATVLSGAGRPGVTVWVGGVGFVITLLANRLFVQAVGLDGPTLRAAAFATSLGTASSLVLGALALKRLLNIKLPLVTLLRSAIAGAAAFYVTRLLPQHSGLLAPVVLVVGALVFFTVLTLTRELGRGDLDALLSVLRKRK
jgi:O-antigen/teichoic acid export membrane protein